MPKKRTIKKAGGVLQGHTKEPELTQGNAVRHQRIIPPAGPFGLPYPTILDLPLRKLPAEQILPLFPESRIEMEKSAEYYWNICTILKVPGFTEMNKKQLYKAVKSAVGKYPFKSHEYFEELHPERHEHTGPAVVFSSWPKYQNSQHTALCAEIVDDIQSEPLKNAFKLVLGCLMVHNGMGTFIQEEEDYAIDMIGSGEVEFENYVHGEYSVDDIQDCAEVKHLWEQHGWYHDGSGYRDSVVGRLENQCLSMARKRDPIERLWGYLCQCGSLPPAEKDMWRWLSGYDKELMKVNIGKYEPPYRDLMEQDGRPITIENQWSIRYSFYSIVSRVAEQYYEISANEAGTLDPLLFHVVLLNGKEYKSPDAEGPNMLANYIEAGWQVYKKHYQNKIIKYYEQYRDR